ncbi:MAG: hypothetical protein EBZ48_02760 [Proteobacteria bacterium]|nr:hypothetical protein [Pseudomonadota bacterium]
MSSELDKDKVVCPLSLMLGQVQNYRVTARPNAGVYESRPVKNTDKYADAFYKVLHAPKGEEVHVTVGGKELTLKGLGQEGAKALHFDHETGVAARAKAVQQVNAGEIRAPRKNWNANFGAEGGTPLDELKAKYPELYNITQRKAKEDVVEVMHEEEFEEAMDGEGTPIEGLNEPLTDEDLAAIDMEIEEHEEAFHVSEEESDVCPKCGQKLAK